MAASLMRIAAQRCVLATTRLPRRAITQPFAKIATSKKNKDVPTVLEPTGPKEPWQKEVEQDVADETKVGLGRNEYPIIISLVIVMIMMIMVCPLVLMLRYIFIKEQKSELLHEGSLAYSFVNHHSQTSPD